MQALAIEAIERLNAWPVWPALLHSLWFGLLAASVVALIFQARPGLSHRARYRILLAALALLIPAPAVATLLQRVNASRPTRAVEAGPVREAAVAAGKPSAQPRSASPASILFSPARSTSRIRHVASIAGFLAFLTNASQCIRPFVVAAWLLGVAVSSVFLALGATAVRRLRSGAEPASELIRARARELARRLRMKQPPEILIHPHIDEPCLCGLRHPTILLPGRWLASAGGDLLDAILSHELAHARRLDHFVNLGQRLVESLFFFHPAVHWLSRSLRSQREFCTDLLAVRVTRDPLALAKALESVAFLRLSCPARRLAGTSLGGQSTFLLPRIEELIGMKPSRQRAGLWPFLAIPAAGLIALVAASSGVAQQAVPRPLPPDLAVKDGAEKQLISYEVRYMSLDAEPWRDRTKDRIKLVHQEADVCAWIVDDKVLFDELTLAQKTVNTNVLQAPKAIAPEGVPLTLSNEGKESYVAQVERIESAGNPAYRPIVKQIDIGVRMELNGTLEARSTKLSVDVHLKSLLAMHTLVRKDQVGEKAFKVPYQIPTPVERRCQLKYEIPDGSSLVISLGIHERRGRSSDPVEAASEVLQFVGLPPVPARSVTCEQLVVIRPRRVALPAGNHPSK